MTRRQEAAASPVAGSRPLTIGVLALQGDFALHRVALERVRAATGDDGPPVTSVEIRQPGQLAGVDGLVVPGGESTTLVKLITDWGFRPALEAFHASGRPIFGTCAGLILLAREVRNPAQFSFGFIDVAVERNAYGRQRESFAAEGVVELDRARRLEMVFIRAPRIRRVGPGVRVLARHDGEPVMVEEGPVLVAAFHPELTDDPAVHEYFCRMVERRRETSAA